MTFVLVLAVYAALFFAAVLPDVRGAKARVVWPCLALFALGLVLQALHEFKVGVPSPSPWIAATISAAFSLR